VPRKGPAPKREVLPDVKYNSRLFGKLINQVLERGKKSLAERICYTSLEIVAKKTGEDGLTVFKKAIDNIKPQLEVKPRRVGGATYQVPVEVSQRRAVTLALRWLVNFAKTRKEKTMAERLAGEIIDAYNKTGSSIKKREDLHKMAEANRAFAHYRW
jgi:small subunit ribosomal protein S7